MSKNVAIKGITVGSPGTAEMIAAIDARQPADHRLDIPLDEIAAAFRHQVSQRHFGKICLAL
jgi:hypothetical protein